MNWRRFDTLFVRLFLLMWITLVASHVIAYVAALPLAQPRAGAGPGGPPGDGADRLGVARLPPLPSLPPGNPFAAEAGRQGPPPEPPTGAGPEGRPPGPPPAAGVPPGLPRSVLWLDYALRALVIALGAWLGARWLARPMQRLVRASGALGDGLATGRELPRLDERRGTREVRIAAQVFNRMAERLREQFDARGLQMAAVSHDLRTPLTRLRMRVEQLPPPQAQAAATDIREMDELIAATLSVLREQRDGAGAQPVDVTALLQALVDDRAEQGHDVQLLAPAGALRALAHPAGLRRVVDNLVGNALRHGGRACITLATAGAGQLEICVDDEGPGIPAGELERVFEPWVQLAGAPARAGHGLGLAIARDLAERDGGRLSLHNRAEGGLRARLLLPAA